MSPNYHSLSSSLWSSLFNIDTLEIKNKKIIHKSRKMYFLNIFLLFIAIYFINIRIGVKSNTSTNFTARILAYNQPKYLKFAEEDFVAVKFELSQFGQTDYKLSFICESNASNCFKFIIGIRVTKNGDILAKFYGFSDENVYKNWKKISVFEVNDIKKWVLLFDELNGLLIFGRNYYSATLAKEKIAKIISDTVGKMPDFKTVSGSFDARRIYCMAKSKVAKCPNQDVEYDTEKRNGYNEIKKSDLIYIAILGVLIVIILVVISLKLFKVEI